MKWELVDDTWLLGKENEGCGVYFEDGEWYANVSFCMGIIGLGPFLTKEQAMKEAESKLNELIKEYA
jgi:hypothetical protein